MSHLPPVFDLCPQLVVGALLTRAYLLEKVADKAGGAGPCRPGAGVAPSRGHGCKPVEYLPIVPVRLCQRKWHGFRRTESLSLCPTITPPASLPRNPTSVRSQAALSDTQTPALSGNMSKQCMARMLMSPRSSAMTCTSVPHCSRRTGTMKPAPSLAAGAQRRVLRPAAPARLWRTVCTSKPSRPSAPG